MADIPRSDLSEIKTQLKGLADDVSGLRAEFRALQSGLDDDIELAVRRRLDHAGKSSRDQTAWLIMIITAVFSVAFGFATIALGIWG